MFSEYFLNDPLCRSLLRLCPLFRMFNGYNCKDSKAATFLRIVLVPCNFSESTAVAVPVIVECSGRRPTLSEIGVQ